MWQDSVELAEVLLLQQEHHVVREDESVAWAHVHSLFKCHLCVFEVRGPLEGEGQVAECLFISRIYFKRI